MTPEPAAPSDGSPPPLFLLVAHLPTPPPDGALELLAARPTCRSLRFARSTDDADSWVLVGEFDGAAGYRAALSPFDVRTLVVPWLSTALGGSGVMEVLAAADRGTGGVVTRLPPTVTPGR